MIAKLYSSVQQLKENNRDVWRYLYKVNKLIVNICYPITQLLNSSIGVDERSDVIVSLTTYPARIKTVWVTIASLLGQSYKPRKVILYLSREQFNINYRLPNSLVRLQKRGLEIVFVEDDLKPHKKYLYALQEFPEYKIITADDDILYPEDHIERFMTASRKYPDAVICDWSHKIAFKSVEEGTFINYNDWEDNATSEPDLFTIPVGCNGVMYKPVFFDETVFDINTIKAISLYTDDLWLKVMEVRNGIKAFNCSKEPLIYFNNIFTMKTGLWHVNTSEDNRNDKVWNNLMNKYPETVEMFCEEYAGESCE